MNKLIIGILVVLNLIVFYFISRKTEKFKWQQEIPEGGPELDPSYVEQLGGIQQNMGGMQGMVQMPPEMQGMVQMPPEMLGMVQMPPEAMGGMKSRAMAGMPNGFNPPPPCDKISDSNQCNITDGCKYMGSNCVNWDPEVQTAAMLGVSGGVQLCEGHKSKEACKDILDPIINTYTKCIWKDERCQEPMDCRQITTKDRCSKEVTGQDCVWKSKCVKDEDESLGVDTVKEIDCNCTPNEECENTRGCRLEYENGECFNKGEENIKGPECSGIERLGFSCDSFRTIDNCIGNETVRENCSWVTECRALDKKDCKKCALLSDNIDACEKNELCKLVNPEMGQCQGKYSVTDFSKIAPCDEPVSVGMGLGNGDSTGPDLELLLNKENCINRVLKTDCEPLNKKYLGEDYETIIKNGMKHQSRCEWIGDTDGLTGEQKVGAQSHHFCDHKEARNCFAYPDFGDKCNQTKECALGYIPSKKEFEELKDLAYDSGLLEQKITELVNQAERFEYGKKCLPKDYINFIKCKLANEANSYQDRKNKCSPKNNCSFVDGFCKVWKPETTTAVAGPIPDSAQMSAPMIPTRTRKTNSEALKQFSEDTGCLLYNEPASDRIQCKPSPYMSSTMAHQPETTDSPDMPSYSANGELIENPFHQLREIDLILNKF